MSFRKALVTGDGVDTNVELTYLPQFLLVGTPDVDAPIEKLAVQVGGNPTQTITVEALIVAFSKYYMEGLLGADVKISQVFKLADGFIKGQNTTITLTNNGVTTPNIYTFSKQRGSRAIGAGQIRVKQDDSENFIGGPDGFEALFFTATNMDQVRLVFSDGHEEKFDNVAELAALFSLTNQTDADGLLGGVCVIDNSEGNILSAEIYATGGDITVLQVI